jgi:predicted ATPase
MIANFHNIIKVKRGPILPFEFFELSEIVDKFFYKLFHIGPLRQEPWRVYSSSGITPIEVGKTGSRAIDALIVREGVMDFIRMWLKKLNIASDIRVEELKEGSERYEVIIKDINTGIDVNMADVGFGVSQVLPVILEFLITPTNSTIMVEQTEIHLHPKAQALIGELLVDILKRRRDMKFIIETHSDLLLSRICTLIAEGKYKKENVIIYYFDPTKNGTKIKEITISEDGQYEKFPKGFFAEKYEEAWRKSEAILNK